MYLSELFQSCLFIFILFIYFTFLHSQEVLAKEGAKRSIENEESLLEDIKLLEETSSEGSPVVQGEIDIDDNVEVETKEDEI